MKRRASPVLLALADLYEASAAGKHGGGRIDFQPDYEALLAKAGCAEGEDRELAERDLRDAEEAGFLERVPVHRRDLRHFSKIRFSPDNEAIFYDFLRRQSPTQRRAKWVDLFVEALDWPVPGYLYDSWQAFCHRRAEAAWHWKGMKGFDVKKLDGGRETLELLNRLLKWEGEHLVRWVSSLLCGDSKTLERRQGVMEMLLADATDGAICSYASLGILPVPSGVTFHGPVRLQIGDEWRDFRGLHGSTTLSGADVERITNVECDAKRCLTIENKTPFQSLAALGSGELLIWSSYPNESTLGLLTSLAKHQPNVEFWHFGDSDPNGFHILADLRARSGLSVQALGMEFRHLDGPPLKENERVLLAALLERMPQERGELEAMLASGVKGNYEQESLGPPPSKHWPFYPEKTL